jgi:hypothetical protein
MKPPAVPGALPNEIADISDLHERMEQVEKIWRESGCQRRAALTAEQSQALAWEITARAAPPTDAEQEKLDATARAAMRKVLAWCRYDPDDDGLPCIFFHKSRRMAPLDFMEAPSARAWIVASWAIWSLTTRILKASGDRASVVEKSHAVRFTSLALKWAGYPSATAPAVSNELRRHPEFQQLVCG